MVPPRLLLLATNQLISDESTRRRRQRYRECRVATRGWLVAEDTGISYSEPRSVRDAASCCLGQFAFTVRFRLQRLIDGEGDRNNDRTRGEATARESCCHTAHGPTTVCLARAMPGGLRRGGKKTRVGEERERERMSEREKESETNDGLLLSRWTSARAVCSSHLTHSALFRELDAS